MLLYGAGKTNRPDSFLTFSRRLQKLFTYLQLRASQSPAAAITVIQGLTLDETGEPTVARFSQTHRGVASFDTICIQLIKREKICLRLCFFWKS